jgi:acyl dehydratase
MEIRVISPHYHGLLGRMPELVFGQGRRWSRRAILRECLCVLRVEKRVVTQKHLPVLGFEDLAVGDEWESPRRTITEAEVVLFAGLTGDFNPLHMDHEAARQGPFGRPVAHGLLGMAIATGLFTQSLRVDTLAFLGILEWNFVRPIHFGDTIHTISGVLALEPRSRGRRGVVTWSRRVFNQAGEIVQDGRTQTLVRGRADRRKADGEPPRGR